MFMKLPLALAVLLLPALANAADITGVAKIRDGDQVAIGSTRIRLGGVDAPSLDQLCLNPKGERWTCGVAARDELVRHVADKSWTCHVQRTDRRGRSIARCDVDGEDIQKWLVKNGWALSYVRFSHDYDADEKAARDARAGLWAGAFIAPWDWRIRNKKTVIMGAVKPPDTANAILLASASGPVGAVARLHHQGQRQQLGRMHLSHARQPLVCPDQDACQQGHPLVLLGRRCRSGGLPRDQAIGATTRRALA